MLSPLPFLILPPRLMFEASAYVAFTGGGGRGGARNVTQFFLNELNKTLSPQPLLLLAIRLPRIVCCFGYIKKLRPIAQKTF